MRYTGKADRSSVFSSLRSGSLGLGCGLWQELLEVFQKVGCRAKQGCDLRIDVLDWFRLPLIRLKDLEELFVNFWFVLKAVL